MSSVDNTAPSPLTGWGEEDSGPSMGWADIQARLNDTRPPPGGLASLASRVPAELLSSLRGPRHRARLVTIDGTQVTVVAASPTGQIDPIREYAVWDGLRAVIADISRRPAGGPRYEPHPGMPPEIAVARWDQGGTAVYATGRHASRAAIRATRQRRHHGVSGTVFAALLAGLSERVITGLKLTVAAGAATSVTLAAAPSVTPLTTHALPPAAVQPSDTAARYPLYGEQQPTGQAKPGKHRRNSRGSRYGVLPQPAQVPAPEPADVGAGDDPPAVPPATPQPAEPTRPVPTPTPTPTTPAPEREADVPAAAPALDPTVEPSPEPELVEMP